jgi:hypothetical protein
MRFNFHEEDSPAEKVLDLPALYPAKRGIRFRTCGRQGCLPLIISRNLGCFLRRFCLNPEIGGGLFEKMHLMEINSKINLLMHPGSGLRIYHGYQIMFP